MKIALPTRDGVIDNHFGHCDHFTIFTIEGDRIVGEETMGSPEGCGCKSDIAPTMAKAGVRLLIGGNMGNGAKNVLNAHGIKVIRGQQGPVREVCETYLSKGLVDSGDACHSHDDCPSS